jgi:hypothetical protein
MRFSYAPSERLAYWFAYPGFRYASPWAEFQYAFGVRLLLQQDRTWAPWKVAAGPTGALDTTKRFRLRELGV